MLSLAQVLYMLGFIFGVSVKSSCSYIYPGNSAYGIFAAIAVPLNIPHRNVFVSYNFEANYNLPSDAQTIIPGPYQRFTSIEENNVNEETVDNAAEETQPADETVVSALAGESRSEMQSTNSKSLITRRAIYQILRGKLKISGFRGQSCLLKLICEANASLVGRNNGVFGSLLHILLTPSTSSYESLPKEIYKAEENGVLSDCFQYENKCPHNILDLFSVPIEDFLHNYA